jgi:hypothetical protein
MGVKTLCVLGLVGGMFVSVWADRPYSTTRTPKTAFTLPDEKEVSSNNKDADPERQWRKQGRREEAAVNLQKKQEEQQKGAPVTPRERRESVVQSTGAVRLSVDKSELDQWRLAPEDRRWESWRKFPVDKQIELWRDLDDSVRITYWDKMNVHERSTLWQKMVQAEKDVCWDHLKEEERVLLCRDLPPHEKEDWNSKLADPNAVAAGSSESDKFKPAHPSPGYVPKSMYREDDE